MNLIACGFYLECSYIVTYIKSELKDCMKLPFCSNLQVNLRKHLNTNLGCQLRVWQWILRKGKQRKRIKAVSGKQCIQFTSYFHLI